MAKLGWPALFLNELIIGENGMIEASRCAAISQKLTTVRALQSCGFETIAAGDSFNDLAMIEQVKLVSVPQHRLHQADYPQFPAYDEFDDLLGAIKKAL